MYFLIQKMHKKFGSHNVFLTQSMHHSEDTKIRLITMMKQSKVTLAKHKPKLRDRVKESKKISNDQELIQSDPTSCPQNPKGNN